jgi:hypothetical protein
MDEAAAVARIQSLRDAGWNVGVALSDSGWEAFVDKPSSAWQDNWIQPAFRADGVTFAATVEALLRAVATNAP